MNARALPLLLLLAAGLLAPSAASAQYKNSAFGLDAGGWFISTPTLLDSKGQPLSPDNRPLRLNQGYRLGLESNFKMNDDHWWLTSRVNVGLLSFSDEATAPLESQFDQEAATALGSIMGVQMAVGLRYYLLTDRFRPYIQAGFSYLKLLSFTSKADNTCSNTTLCDTGRSNLDNFLPHGNIPAVHLQPGFEWIVTRDVGITMFTDLQRWILLNADGNYSLVLGLGVTLYT